MRVGIKPFKADGEITAPPSKSFAHRYIIAAFLSGKKCTVLNAGDSDDVRATIRAVQSLGGKITVENGEITVWGREKVSSAVVDCGESGSTMRFLLPVAAALNINATFTGSERLCARPVDALAAAIKGHGASISGRTVSGRLESGVYRLDASLSSQYITGLLFALAAVRGESEIVLSGKKVSSGYVDITLSVLREFGVNVSRTERGFKIFGCGNFNPPEKAVAEGDWSGAAFMLAVGALTGRVTVKGLKYPTLQPDGNIAKLLKKFGAKITVSDGGVTAEKQSLIGIKDVDCENFPDIVQVICAVAAFAKGDTTLTGVERLKIKESDRIAAIKDFLAACSVACDYQGGKLTVHGKNPKGGCFSGGGDHRTAMSAAVIASAADGASYIDGAECCAKSYPRFFEDIETIGGKTDVGI